MTEEHSGPGIAHDLSDFLAFFGSVTVHSAFGASWFLSAKGAALNALGGIIQKGLASGAKLPAFRGVMGAAKEGDHFCHSAAFPGEAFIHLCPRPHAQVFAGERRCLH